MGKGLAPIRKGDKEEAEKILKLLEERLNKFGLDLSKEKTRLIECGEKGQETGHVRLFGIHALL
jgi:hypothetical protein